MSHVITFFKEERVFVIATVLLAGSLVLMSIKPTQSLSTDTTNQQATITAVPAQAVTAPISVTSVVPVVSVNKVPGKVTSAIHRSISVIAHSTVRHKKTESEESEQDD